MGGWNKGLTKDTDDIILKQSISMKTGYRDGRIIPAKGYLGKIAWNKGLTKNNHPGLARASEKKKTGYSNGTMKHGNSIGKHWRLSEETKKKQSLAKIGKRPLAGIPQSPELIAKRVVGIRKFRANNPGYKVTHRNYDSWYNNISKNFFGKGKSSSFPGEKNGNWKGGLSRLPYGFEFNPITKLRIKERDKYVCQNCGVPHCECIQGLTIHHIDYNKKNNCDTNLISLCTKCNSKANKNRPYWTDYYNNKIKYIYLSKLTNILLLVAKGIIG